MRGGGRACLYAALGLIWLFQAPSHAVPAGIVFIVNQRNPARSVNENELVEYYEKKKRQWPDGTAVRFVDRKPGSQEREKFLRIFLGRSESEIDFYWYAEKIRSGKSAPIQVSSDTLVIEMVKSFPGAIGYVSSLLDLSGEGVKPIEILGVRTQ